MRSKVYITSADVNGSPLWNVRLGHEVEHPRRRSICFQDGGELAVERAVGVDVDELAEDVVVDLGAGVDRRGRRVERVRLAGQRAARVPPGSIGVYAANLARRPGAGGRAGDARAQAAPAGRRPPRGRPPARWMKHAPRGGAGGWLDVVHELMPFGLVSVGPDESRNGGVERRRGAPTCRRGRLGRSSTGAGDDLLQLLGEPHRDEDVLLAREHERRAP